MSTTTVLAMAPCAASGDGASGGGPPTGSIFAYAAIAAPSGYLLCDGAAVSRATYLTLFEAIGTTWGVGDNSTTFNVPNLKGRVAVGLDAGQTEFDTLAEVGGAKTVTSSGTVAAPTFTGTSNVATNAVSAGTPAGTNSAPTFTGTSNQATSAVSAGTPAGTINAHTTAADSNTTGGTAKVTGPGTHTFTGSALGTHSHTLTPAGTVSAPTFTGSALGTHSHTMTPSGTNSAPAFTGAAHQNLQPYVTVQYIIKT